jgi:hypothetical protein
MVASMMQRISQRVLGAVLTAALAVQQVAPASARDTVLRPDVRPVEALLDLEELARLRAADADTTAFSAVDMAPSLGRDPLAVAAHLSRSLVYRPYAGAINSADAVWTDREANAIDVALMLAASLGERAEVPRPLALTPATLAGALDAGFTREALEYIYGDMQSRVVIRQLGVIERTNDMLSLSPGLLTSDDLSDWRPLTPETAVDVARDHAWLVFDGPTGEIVLDPFAARYGFATPAELQSISLARLDASDPDLFFPGLDPRRTRGRSAGRHGDA